jgi:hypothetical protein
MRVGGTRMSLCSCGLRLLQPVLPHNTLLVQRRIFCEKKGRQLIMPVERRVLYGELHLTSNVE